MFILYFFFFSSRRRHTRFDCDWSSDVCSSDLPHVVVVAIDNQPRRNAMPRAMMAELATLWDRLERDGTCRCIVLTGAGARAFSSGADVSGELPSDPQTARVGHHAPPQNRAVPQPPV